MPRDARQPRPLKWVGSARKTYLDFPEKLRAEFGYQLHLAQVGLRPPSAKLLRGLGSGMIELVEDFDGDTFRPFTPFDTRAVCVFHTFKKKSKQGIKTPQSDIDLIRRRLQSAEAERRPYDAEKSRDPPERREHLRRPRRCRSADS